MSGDVVERICHKEQLGIWAGEIASILSLGEFLKDDWTFDDSVDLETELAAQLRDVIASALTHPEINVTDLIASQAAEIAQLKKERDGLTERLATAYRVKAECNDDANNERHLRLTAERLLAEARAALEWSARLFDGIRGAVETNQVVDKDVHGTAISGRDAARAAARTLTNGGENGR